MVRALQITRLWVEALDVSCRILSLAFAAQLVDPRDLVRRQTVLFRVKRNRERAKIIRENQSETLPVLFGHRPNGAMKIDAPAALTRFLLSFGTDYVRPDVKLGRRKINHHHQRSALINLRLNSVGHIPKPFDLSRPRRTVSGALGKTVFAPTTFFSVDDQTAVIRQAYFPTNGLR